MSSSEILNLAPARALMEDLSMADPVEEAKQRAAFAAVDKFIGHDAKIIGIGSGTTVPYALQRVVAQGPGANSGRVFIPTSFQSKELIIGSKLVLGDVDQHTAIDVTIDGADEVDVSLNCIKGGGACQLREKVLAEASKIWVVVADYRKDSQVLGTNFTSGVPIEVVPFAYARVLQNLKELGSPNAVLRMAKMKAGPVVTDNGNFVIDAPFSKDKMSKPTELLPQLKKLTGVVEVGLFCGLTKAAYFGNKDGSVTIRSPGGKMENIPVQHN